jgi:uncharacterized membrane protein
VVVVRSEESVLIGLPPKQHRRCVMGHIKEVIHIGAPPERVWKFLTAYERAPEWQTNVIEVKDFEGKPGEVGFAYTGIYRALGRQMESRSRITRADFARLLEEKGSGPGGSELTVSNQLEATPDEGTKLTFELDYDLGAGFFSGIADKLLIERAIERDVRHSSENLKALIEAEVAVSA